MDERERQQVADYWLKKYGDPIDCPELAANCSSGAIERVKVLVADAQQMESLADLLERQESEVLRFLGSPLPGTSESLWRRLERLGEEADEHPVFSDVTEAPVAPMAGVIAKRCAELGELARRFSQGLRREAQERVPWALPTGRRSFENVGLGWAGLFASEWIRERHRGRRGELDGETSWTDTVRCLEWHGHVLNQEDKAAAVRMAAKRHRRTLPRRRTAEA